MAYTLQCRYTLLSQRCQNNWVFNVINGPATAQILAEAFEFSIWTQLMVRTTDNVVGQTMVIQNLDDPLDFGEFPFIYTPQGQLDLDPMPSYVSHAVTMLRPRADIKNGSKRFAGIARNDVSGNVVTTNWTTNLNIVIDSLMQGFTNVDADATFQVAYFATPKGETEPIIVTPLGMTYKLQLGSQNSRKPGYGI